jgi:hypothetical protein
MKESIKNIAYLFVLDCFVPRNDASGGGRACVEKGENECVESVA